MIACSIPLLRPLLEAILDGNPFKSSKATGSKSAPHYYDGNYYPKGSAIELKDRKPKKVKDDLGFTMVAEGNSQESILAPEQKPTEHYDHSGF